MLRTLRTRQAATVRVRQDRASFIGSLFIHYILTAFGKTLPNNPIVKSILYDV
jgi:hypothetical protein